MRGLLLIWVLSSVGRASPLQGECQRFDPVSTHHFNNSPKHSGSFACLGAVVQLVRIPACHAGGRGFESRPLRQHYKGCCLFKRRPFLFAAYAAGCHASAVVLLPFLQKSSGRQKSG